MGSGVMKNFARVALVALVSVSTTVACSSSTPSSVVAPTPTLNTIKASGVVPAAVNGVPQSDSQLFNVGQSGGTTPTVTFTLTSATETFPNGTPPNTAVVMGLAIGAPSGTTCTVAAGATVQLVQASATPLSATLNPGAYCIQISDQTIQQGPVAYTIVIVTPQ